MALSKSQIRKIDRHDEYVVFWPLNFRVPDIIAKMPELKKYETRNPLQIQSKVYLVTIDLAREIYRKFNAIEDELDFYKVIVPKTANKLSKKQLYDNIKNTIQSGIEISTLSYGETYTKQALGFKRIYNNEL